MAVVVDMPKLSDTMEEGGIAEWLKKEGDTIEEGEPLLTIETDKATMEFASPVEGTLLKIIAPAGKTVALQQPIAIVGDKGEAIDVAALLGKKTAAADSKKAAHPPAGAAPAATKAAPPAPPRSTASSQPAPAPSTTAKEPTGRIKASPLAKKMAAAQGIDLASVTGSGPHGRIVQRDIATHAAAAAPSAKAASVAGRRDEQIPHTMMRKTIAKRLLAGKNEAPHFYLTVSADMAAMLKWRAELNRLAPGQAQGDAGPKVSVNDLIILAAAKALRLHPLVNSAWHDDYVLQHGSIDIAMAVALPSGLVTPVIRAADQLGVRDIARATKAAAQKAKDGKLVPSDYSGGTFTISNLGMTKVEEFTAIINPPQACILAVGTTQTVPWVNEQRQVVVADRMKMTLSCDHRVVDGMVGARYLETLVSYIENPLLMLA